ncbi:MAG: reverse transcriptase domain-containing protein [Caldicoprobacterales bacterium]
MHYAFDEWMVRMYSQAPFERYADDAIIHCRTEAEAKEILAKLIQRLKECKLELHPTKTKIVYCKDKDRKRDIQIQNLTFLGTPFNGVYIKDRSGRLQFNFLPLVSKRLQNPLEIKSRQCRYIALQNQNRNDCGDDKPYC